MFSKRSEKGMVFVMEENKNENEIKEEKKVEENVQSENNKKEEKTNVETEKNVKKETEVKNASSTDTDAAKFKKVETNGSKVQVEKKKKHKLAKAILILIILGIVIYFVFVMRNLFILRDILDKASSYKNLDNYTVSTLANNNGEQTSVVYAKNGQIERVDLTNLQDELKNITLWRNLETNEGIISFPNQRAAVLTDAEHIGITVSYPTQYAYYGEAISGLGLFSLIYSEEFNGKECYVIQNGVDSKTWVEKETGLTLKAEYGKDMSSEVTDFKVNTIGEIYKPDLTGYEINQNQVEE